VASGRFSIQFRCAAITDAVWPMCGDGGLAVATSEAVTAIAFRRDRDTNA